MEDMVMIGSKDEFMAGYKLVPWSTWGQWSFVCESIFSSNPESVTAALRRVAAWRSRGCLPAAVDITAVIVEIQHKDPFFREGLLDAMSSEELLAMLYCMAIVRLGSFMPEDDMHYQCRLVNVFVEPSHKKTGRSISELATAIGLPRALIDIRHESSHRDLPSLQLVRKASVKALDWLKFNYWELQRKAIPDVQKEIRCRLREMIYYIKAKHTQRMKAKRAKRSHQLRACGKLSALITGKLLSSKAIDFNKQISKISISVCRLYTSYPLDVVSVLREFFQLHVYDFSDATDKEIIEDSDVCHEPLINSMSVLKTIITKLSHNRPRLLLCMLKTVLEMIKDIHEKRQVHFPSPLSEAKVCQIKHLCSFVPWLLMNLKILKDSGRIGLMEELKPLPGRDAVQNVSLKKLLRLCLSLSAVGDKHLSEAVLLLSDLSGNTKLTERLKKLSLPCLQDQGTAEYSYSNIESVLSQEEIALKKANERLQYLKLQSRISNVKSAGTVVEDNDAAKNLWMLAKSWIPCPIGMLPCSFSLISVLPALDKVDDDCQSIIISENNRDMFKKDHTPSENHKIDMESPDSGNAVKRLRLTTEERLYSIDMINPLEGRLLIDGVWKKVDEDELLAIQYKIRTFG